MFNLKKYAFINVVTIIIVIIAYSVITAVGLVTIYDAINRQFEIVSNKYLKLSNESATSVFQLPKHVINYAYPEFKGYAKSKITAAENRRLVRLLKDSTVLLSSMDKDGSSKSEVYAALKNAEGIFRIVTLAEEEVDYINPEERKWFKKAVEAKGDVAYSFYEGIGTGDKKGVRSPVMSVSRAVFDEAGEVSGILCADISSTEINAVISTLNPSENGYAMLVDEDLNIVAHEDASFALRNVNALDESFAVHIENMRGIQPNEIRQFKANNYKGLEANMYIEKNEIGWILVLVSPVSDVWNAFVPDAITLLTIDTIVAVIVICTVVGSYKLGSKALQENRSKSTFLARMSHEIRTPMNAVIGMSELILREEIPEAIETHIMTIRQAGKNLLDIVNDILDFSKIEAGSMPLGKTRFGFTSMLNDVVSIIRVRLVDRPVVLLLELDPNMPGVMIGDEMRLRQILMNLLSNAVKYTERGHILIRVSGKITGLKGSKDMTVTISVTDTGIGIKAADMKFMFGEFNRMDETKNSHIEGSGLGLVITRSLCRAMGGDVTVQSDFGKGSTFTARINLQYDKNEPLAKVAAPKHERVLIFSPELAYSKSIAKSLSEIKVYSQVAETKEQFYDSISSQYTYIFVSSEHYNKTLRAISEKKLVIGLVRLLNIEETPNIGELALEMPAYCVSLANLLNKAKQITLSYKDEVFKIMFKAPDARVLVVDDIEANLKVAEELLKPYGVQIDVCDSGKGSIDLVKKNDYQIVFMDHMMPGMDGLEAAQLIRRLSGRGQSYYSKLPIVALTANAVSGMRDILVGADKMSDYLTKPIEMAQLNRIMLKWIPKSMVIYTESDSGASDDKPRRLDVSGKSLRDISVYGLDMDEGLTRFGGNEEAYRNVLTTFLMSTPAMLDKIDAFMELSDTTPGKRVEREFQESLEHFTIIVHGLRGSCGSICAMKISGMAKEIELSSRDGNVDFVFSRCPGLVKETRKLLADLSALGLGTVAAVKQKMKAPPLKVLQFLVAALREMDASKIESAVNLLFKYDYEDEPKLMGWVKEQIDDFEYDAVVERLKAKYNL
ncbi:hypothetical protein FACS1894133_2770 [Clostridia bacterium]|nr:hypothetical protein FACS1894133_2770 [Clostridia bacterium]